MKKLLSLVLVLCLIVGNLSPVVLASEPENVPPSQSETSAPNENDVNKKLPDEGENVASDNGLDLEADVPSENDPADETSQENNAEPKESSSSAPVEDAEVLAPLAAAPLGLNPIYKELELEFNNAKVNGSEFYTKSIDDKTYCFSKDAKLQAAIANNPKLGKAGKEVVGWQIYEDVKFMHNLKMKEDIAVLTLPDCVSRGIIGTLIDEKIASAKSDYEKKKYQALKNELFPLLGGGDVDLVPIVTEPAVLSGATNLRVKKNFTGRVNMDPNDLNNWLDSDSFSFGIYAKGEATLAALRDGDITFKGNENIITVNKASNGTGAFKDITFKKAGTYTFTVEEKMPKGATEGNNYTDNKIRYDNKKIIITVEVSDTNNDKQLEANVTSMKVGDTEVDAMVFDNTYELLPAVLSGATNLKVKKNFTGRVDNNPANFSNWLDSDSFSFGIYASGAVTMNALRAGDITFKDNKNIVTVNKASNGTGAFKDITFKKAGTYTFKVEEKMPEGATEGNKYTKNQIKYDNKKIIVTVEVNNSNNDNRLDAAVTSIKVGDTEVDAMVFNNTYSAAPAVLSGAQNLKVTKTLTGKSWTTEEFKFTLGIEDDNTLAEFNIGNIQLPESLTITAKSNAKTPNFGDITFKKPGTYKFVIKEVNGDLGGITYDNSVKTVTVTVAKNTSGNLVISSVTGKDSLTFTNSYTPADLTVSLTRAPSDTSIGLALKKNIENGIWRDGYEFKFKIEALNGAPAPSKTECTITGPDQLFDFGTVTVKAANMNGAAEKTFRYKVTELIPTTPIHGITYTTEPVFIALKVKDNKQGNLISVGLVLNEADSQNEAVFTNTFTPDPVTLTGENAISVTKNFTGRVNSDPADLDNWLATDTFNFTLNPLDSATERAVAGGIVEMNDNTASATKTNRAAVFGDIVFKDDGTFVFEITENRPLNATAENNYTYKGIRYDTTSEKVTVGVIENDAGQLVITSVTYDGDRTFNNTYSTDPAIFSGRTGLQVNKVLTGRDWTENDKFEFKLTMDASQAGKVEIRAPLANATMANKTGVAIGDIKFNEEGTYNFKLYEVEGTEKYMHYDTKVYDIAISVNDNDEGALEVTAVNGNQEFGPFAFENKYMEEHIVSVTKQVAKTTTDKDFEFSYIITDKDTNEAPEAVELIFVKELENGDTEVIEVAESKGTFTLKDNETLHMNLPENLHVKVMEKDDINYEVTINENGELIEGTEVIDTDSLDTAFEVVNTYKNRRPRPDPRPNPNPGPRPYPVIRPVVNPTTGANI